MEVNKLTIVQQGLEKSLNAILAQLKKCPDYQEVFNLRAELENDRCQTRETLQASLKETVSLVKDKTELLKHDKILEINDLRLFKTQMILIQENIKNLKAESKAKLRQIRDEYTDVADDLDYYTEKIPQWSETAPLQTELSKKPTTSTGPKCKEVRAFIDFVHKSGGHENGWRKEDHQLFLRLRQKHKNIDTLARHLHETLPDISEAETEAHEKWYREYLSLQAKKRGAVKAWKAKKTARTEPSSGSDAPKTVTAPRPHESMKEMLLEWKLEKQQKLQSALLVQQAEEERRRAAAEERRKHQQDLKTLVENWKRTKAEIEEEETTQRKAMEERERRRRAAEANRMIKQFQVQDDLYIVRKQSRKPEDLKPARSKSSQLAKRDPARLMKPTQQWINKVHDENDYSREGFYVSLKTVPKLQIPEWRKRIE